MPKYFAVVGVNVRVYAKFDFEAESDSVAIDAAIEHFKADKDDIAFEDTDWNNKSMPSICSLDNEDTSESVTEGFDFSLCEQDRLEYNAGALLESLKESKALLSEHAYYKDGVIEHLNAIDALILKIKGE